MIHVTPYTQWRETQMRSLIETGGEVCEDCDGAGYVECSECEGEGTDWDGEDCEFCGSAGDVRCWYCNTDDNPGFSMSAYRHQLLEDAYSLSAWTNREPLSVLGDMVKGGAFR